jgi:predicted amino acid dehydrogenase
MKLVASVSLGSRKQDFDFRCHFLGQTLRVRRFGSDGRTDKALRLLRRWEKQADAIGLGVPKDDFRIGGQRFVDSDAARLKAAVSRVPVTSGSRLTDILQEWAVRHTQSALGGVFTNARVIFLGGMAHFKLAKVFSEFSPNLRFADPILQLGVPKLLSSLEALSLFAQGTHYVRDWVPARTMPRALFDHWTRFVLSQAMRKATVVVAMAHELDPFGLEELAGKTVITSDASDERIAQWRDKGVAMVVDGSPHLYGHVLGPQLLDAMILAATGRRPDDMHDDDYLEIIERLELAPRVLYPNGFKRVNRFAFVIHPLSQEHLKHARPIELLSEVAPPLVMDTLEKAMAFAPPMLYSHITGIRSPTGVEAEGWLITVGGTAREIMSHGPEFTYRRLLDAADMARRLGAQIMGLGAFTKVVGDAGATVARRAALPVTTGNSYSASAALWAAHDALLRLRLVSRRRGKARAHFKAMVVGATGSIGAACSRLLAKVAAEVMLVSPETGKLLALRDLILRETPDAQLALSARANRRLGEMDMIVTATSGVGKKVLDIMKVKPGCVITDVARPLDLPPEEIVRRPDVLVIESGEIQLPGDVQMRDIGLPKNVTYACLAETIVLALEGRFESYTVGRSIEWEKVREIYKLGLKHGMKLAAISGVNGVFSDADIERVRALALEARSKWGAGRRRAGERNARATRDRVPRAKAAGERSVARVSRRP